MEQCQNELSLHGANKDRVADTWYKDIHGDGITVEGNNRAIFGSFKDHFYTVYSNNIVQPNECHEWT